MLKTILFISLVLLFSCRDGGGEIGGITNDQYNQINDPLPEPTPDVDQDNPCPRPTDDGTGNMGDLDDHIGTITCQKKCPHHYSVLKELDEVDPLGHFAFPNAFRTRAGKCRGYTITQQKFNMLAEFNKGKNPNNCGHGKPMTSNCKSLYKRLVDDIINFKVTEIPGFNGLHQFSRDPYIQGILSKEIKSWSHRFTASSPHLSEKTGNHKLDVFNEVMKRVEKRQMPYLGIKGNGIGDHAVMPYKMKVIAGKKALCIRDPNIQPTGSDGRDMCSNYMYKEGSNVYYHRKGKRLSKMSKFNIYGEEDKRTVKYVEARKKYCVTQMVEGGLCVQ
ncbi:MAG: hypothetical protein KC493_06925 [Bacteriovoracaceae bacterium]|nr:hypothetical protein [Bacteriovoracaceae bacterium]